MEAGRNLNLSMTIMHAIIIQTVLAIHDASQEAHIDDV